MTYLDMTFCGFYVDCALAPNCPRPLTAEVRRAAAEWWGRCSGEPPIAQYAEPPKCYAKEAPR